VRLSLYAVVSKQLSPTCPLGAAVETLVRREDAERFIEKVRGDDPDFASHLRIEERELEAAGPLHLSVSCVKRHKRQVRCSVRRVG
jgi:hypothetical protein